MGVCEYLESGEKRDEGFWNKKGLSNYLFTPNYREKRRVVLDKIFHEFHN